MNQNLDNLFNLSGKVALITGGNKGIGLGITKSFVDAGYHVYIGAREEIEIEEKYQGKVFFQYTDVKNESDHIKLLETVIDNYGKIDCYINNAGFSEWRPIEKIDDDFLSDILNTNLKGAFWGCPIFVGAPEAAVAVSAVPSQSL